MLTIYEIKAISVYIYDFVFLNTLFIKSVHLLHPPKCFVMLLSFPQPSFGPIRGIHSLTATPRAPLWCTRGQYVRGRSLWGYSVRRERTRWDEIFVVCRAKCVQFSFFAPPPEMFVLLFQTSVLFKIFSAVDFNVLWILQMRILQQENLKYHFDALNFIIFSMFGFYKS